MTRHRFAQPTKIPISFNENFVPKVSIGIGDKTLSASLHLKSKYPLYLQPDVLDKTPTKDRGMGSSRALGGGLQEMHLYEIDLLEFGDWKWRNVLASENNWKSNWVGWPLEKANILIDFPHRYVCHIRTKKQLQKLGLDLKQMQKIPCTVNKKGVFFEGEVDGKLSTFYLSTSTNVNCIRQELCSGPDDKIERTAIASGCFLGSYRFTPIVISPELGADYILGAEFLEDHIVYLDAQNQEIYVGNPYCKLINYRKGSIISVGLIESGVPYVEMELNGKMYRMMLDLGADNEVTLAKDYGEAAKLQLIGTAHSSNFFGAITASEVFLAESIRIGKSTFPNVLVQCASKVGANVKMNYEKLGGTSRKDIDGAIGYPLLAHLNFYLDLKQGVLQFANDISEILIDPDAYERVRFEISNSSIHILAETDLGDLKLLLDSGSPFSAIKKDLISGKALVEDDYSNLVYRSSKFQIGPRNWGVQNFFPLPIDEEFGGIDGILGADFLRKRAVFVDSRTKEIWIEKQQESDYR